jgi:excisionase family DNA binding protein
MLDDRPLTIDEAAAYCRVSVVTLRRWIRQRRVLRPMKIGRRLLFRPEQLEWALQLSLQRR